MRYYANVNKEKILHAVKNHNCYDSWGEVQYGDDKRAVEYNICIDNTTEKTEYLSAFYRILKDENGNWQHDGCQEWFTYNIDFSDKDWKKKLKEASKQAFAKLWSDN